MFGFFRPKSYERARHMLEQAWAIVPGASKELMGSCGELVDSCFQELKSKNLLDDGGFGRKVIYRDALQLGAENLRGYFDWCRSEGVPEEDLVAWWDEPNLVRYVAVKSDEVLRLAAYLSNLEALKDAFSTVQEREAAARDRVWYQVIMYGSNPGPEGLPPDRWLLPFELSRRIGRALIVNRSLLAGSSEQTINARIRHLIRTGAI